MRMRRFQFSLRIALLVTTLVAAGAFFASNYPNAAILAVFACCFFALHLLPDFALEHCPRCLMIGCGIVGVLLLGWAAYDGAVYQSDSEPLRVKIGMGLIFSLTSWLISRDLRKRKH